MRNTSTQPDAPTAKQWLQVAAATMLVSGCPIAAVWWLRVTGTVSSALVGVVLGMMLSLAASYGGRVLWEKHPGSEDLLFSELMIWGFLHRRRSQRRLASARKLVGSMSDAQRRSLDGLSVSEQAKQLERLVAGVETRDPYLHGHSRRVARYSWMIAKRMGLAREEIARVRTAAAIHDVGKIEVPKAVLHKKGRLTDEEYEVIKRHPEDGAKMVAALRDSSLTAMVRHHHERLDGTGYPSGLSGAEIPLGARIIAVADTFDAITSSRPYRAASAHKKAIDILHEEAGTRIDAVVVKAFCDHYAGRRSLVIWTAVAGFPERVAAWLSSTAAGVASAAKVVAVAAIVGTTAATTSSLAAPPAKHHPAPQRVASTALPGQHAARSTLAEQSPPTSTRGTRRATRRGSPKRQPRPTSAAGRTGSAPQSGNSSAGSPQSNAPAARERAPGSPAEEAPSKGRAEEHSSNTHEVSSKPEEASKSESEETSKAQVEETTSAGSTAANHASSEESHDKGEATTVAAAGKSEESQGKSEESHAKSEESAGKSEASAGKVEEHAGPVKEVVKVVGEVVGKAKELLPKL